MPKPRIPLAARVRPETLAEVFGQDHLTQGQGALAALIEKDAFNALLFWGPPGCGKTTMARMIADYSKRDLVELSAVQSGVKDIRSTLEQSQFHIDQGQKSLLLFMDEIHHLNKSQQDILLPALEQGTIKFIGATTENPSFEVNKAILSRCLTFKLERLTIESLKTILKRAMAHPESDLTQYTIDDDALDSIAQAGDGDARRALNLLDAALNSLSGEQTHLKKEDLKRLGPSFMTAYDKEGEQHYDVISAFIKSVRGSHPDAAVYYLARMLDAGEDVMFIARRIIILASEDVGNANPTALLVATAAAQAVHMVGMPEARIILSQAVTYLAASPKSNRSYVAINHALEDVKALGSLEVPLHLRNAPTKLMKEFGYGQFYAYAHDNLEGARKMTYMPSSLKGKRYYDPSKHGAEAQLASNLEKIRPVAD